MKILSFTEARANFAKTLDAVVEDAEETIIHRAGHEPVVIISLSEWNALKGIQYLLSDPPTRASCAGERPGWPTCEHGMADSI